jgi:hypothetical protein
MDGAGQIEPEFGIFPGCRDIIVNKSERDNPITE